MHVKHVFFAFCCVCSSFCGFRCACSIRNGCRFTGVRSATFEWTTNLTIQITTNLSVQVSYTENIIWCVHCISHTQIQWHCTLKMGQLTWVSSYFLMTADWSLASCHQRSRDGHFEVMVYCELTILHTLIAAGTRTKNYYWLLLLIPILVLPSAILSFAFIWFALRLFWCLFTKRVNIVPYPSETIFLTKILNMWCVSAVFQKLLILIINKSHFYNKYATLGNSYLLIKYTFIT